MELSDTAILLLLMYLEGAVVAVQRASTENRLASSFHSPSLVFCTILSEKFAGSCQRTVSQYSRTSTFACCMSAIR